MHRRWKAGSFSCDTLTDADLLRRLLPEIAFQQAIQSIETIALKTEDKQMYDTREKAARDYQWLINGARNEGREEGIEKGAMIGTIIDALAA
ncbi:MAG: hypothetical protein SGI77_11545 [Pirellulaceae bacterium]|nr:hypothetical protein [Pirellulaceae bacterium]